jgi:FkbM family methyltransferase
MSFKIIKKASLSFGLYRQARALQRYLNKSEMETYLSDKKFYSQLIPQAPALCFDVGANIGRMTEVLLTLGHNVVAFEPQPECVREIKARSSPFKRRLQIQQSALGSNPGTESMFVRESSAQTSLRPAWEGKVTGTVQVPVSTLDIAIERFGLPYYCKIDVEGWELHVLQGLSQPIPLLSFEYHQEEDKMNEAFACLERLRSISKISVNITPREQSRFALDDWIDADGLKTVFEERFRGKVEFLFGDIYARML